MRLVDLKLIDVYRFLDSRKQVYKKLKNPDDARCVAGVRGDDEELHGVIFWERLSEDDVKLGAVNSDGSPLGFTILYGGSLRNLFMSFKRIHRS